MAQLKEYRQKRDFKKTPEPRGRERKTKSRQPVFVIQEHDARALHYDFRLQIDGVLKSWAVPKGPSTNPRDKRLAMQTEDHPLEYAKFEGVIPEGEYGAGPVIIWDSGRYENLRQQEGDGVDMADSLKEGKIEVYLSGKKLSGGYALIRRGKDGDGKWFLIKMKDKGADARRNLVKSAPKSVLSGKTIDELREAS